MKASGLTTSRRISGHFFAALTGTAALIILLILVVIVGDALRGGLSRLSWEFITAAPEQGMTAGGIFPAIWGTAVVTILMTIGVMPIGVTTAIYLHEYASLDSRLARIVRAAIANLAGVPSVVFGLFGLGFFVRFVGEGLDRAAGADHPRWGQPGLLWAAATLAVLTLPVVIVSTEEALRSVPKGLRIASLALGATKSQTVWRVVLPGALPGIMTGAILAVARGAGEVAPILLTGAAYFLPDLPKLLSSQFMHLGYHVYVLATQSPDVEATTPLLYGTVLVLLLLTFALNLVAVVIRARMRRFPRFA
jgi:phosphate transport system permease protein